MRSSRQRRAHRTLATALAALLLAIVPMLANSSERGSPPVANELRRTLRLQPNSAANAASASNQPDYAEGEVIVKFRNDLIDILRPRGERALTSFSRAHGVSRGTTLHPLNMAVLKSATSTAAELIKQLRDDPLVEYAEPNFRQHLQTVPNDTEFSKLWGMNNTGQTVNGVAGTADADIDAPEAWNTSTGSTAVTVAVIDSGVSSGHPDLAGNLVAGYDFVDSDSTPEDFNDHGTHVAGAISAVGNNAAGVTGVNWNVKIMPLRVADATGSILNSNFILALNYAVAQGVKIVNYSAGGSGYSQSAYDAIANARNSGVLIMAAAGNSANNNDGGLHFYPSDYTLDNIVSVAATDQNDALASFSNYGATSVDVAAPGVNIYSTVPFRAFSENFNGATTPGFTGTQFTASGTNNYWMTEGPGDIAAYGDTNLYPYQNDSNGILTSSIVDTSSYTTVYLQYDFAVESEFDASCTKDYLLVEVYTGSVWTEVRHRDVRNGDARRLQPQERGHARPVPVGDQRRERSSR